MKPYGTKTLYLPWQDNLHTDQFTPKSFQVDLLEKAILGNRVVCINSEKDKLFIVVKLTSELSLRGRLKKKWSILLSTKVSQLERYKTSFTSTTNFKHIYMITEEKDLKTIDFEKVIEFYKSKLH